MSGMHDESGVSTALGTPMRPLSPDDSIQPAARGNHSNGNTNPFGTPYSSTEGSTTGSMTGPQYPAQRYFHSRRVKKGEVEKPWLKKKDPREKWVTIIPILGIICGLGISGVLVWDGLRTVVNHSYCPVLDEDFTQGLRPDIWTKEVECGGFGNGQFEVTTDSEENAFIKDGQLYLKPTLQDPSLIENERILDLRDDGCTSNKWMNCYTGTNITNGTIINPVKSARINTKAGVSIKYGRIEVTAQLPAGDWLWPAIWMLPTDSVYGPWPQSGEMDLMESRGNNYTYPQGGNNIMSSTLHFGPDPANDAWWRNNVKREALHSTYADGFHTYGVEWSEKYVFTYVDTRLLQVMYTNFDQPFWTYGAFPPSDENGTRVVDPWSQTGRDATPFDQDFYLILNVAVGGTNGWFQDGIAGKPWVDSSPTARKEFWDARDMWLPTWADNGQMIVSSVKMWQQSGYNGCFK